MYYACMYVQSYVCMCMYVYLCASQYVCVCFEAKKLFFQCCRVNELKRARTTSLTNPHLSLFFTGGFRGMPIDVRLVCDIMP